MCLHAFCTAMESQAVLFCCSALLKKRRELKLASYATVQCTCVNVSTGLHHTVHIPLSTQTLATTTCTATIQLSLLLPDPPRGLTNSRFGAFSSPVFPPLLAKPALSFPGGQRRWRRQLLHSHGGQAASCLVFSGNLERNRQRTHPLLSSLLEICHTEC